MRGIIRESIFFVRAKLQTDFLLAFPQFPAMLPRLRFATQLRTVKPVYRLLSTKAAAHACPNCSASITSLSPTCPSCTSLLPPPPANTSHFDLFAIPASYDLDQAKLKKAFLDWQRKVHPDKFSAKEDQTWAKEWSGRVNEGFRALEGDRSRGEYLVRLYFIFPFRIWRRFSVSVEYSLMTVRRLSCLWRLFM